MKVIMGILMIFISFSGCSLLNPGFLSSEPNLSMLELHKSTLEDVEKVLGSPAVSQMQFNEKLVYKYFYQTSDSVVNQTAMIKGDYHSGCKNCGEIIITFRWNKELKLDEFLVQAISISDSTLKEQAIRALTLLQEKKFQEAYPLLLDTAQKNYIPAQHVLALMYINGDGVEQNYQQAKVYLMRAALAEYPPALYDLGAMFKNGEGVAINLELAKSLYIKSAQLKYRMAIQELIKIYQEEGNETQMNFWIKKSEQIQ